MYPCCVMGHRFDSHSVTVVGLALLAQIDANFDIINSITFHVLQSF